MTGSQYKNVAQWTLANLPPETAESPIATAKAILDHCAVAFPHGNNLEVLTTLMSNAYMGWESCTFAQAEEAANYGIAAVGMDTDHLVVILPEDTTGLTGGTSQDATQNPIARQAADIPLSERLSMQFFAYTAASTSTHTWSYWAERVLYMADAVKECVEKDFTINGKYYDPDIAFSSGQWCVDFVRWCCKKAGVYKSNIIGALSSTTYLHNWYRDTSGQQDTLHNGYSGIQRGDIVFITYNGKFAHTAIATSAPYNGKVDTISGNWSSAVTYETFPLGAYAIHSYAHPHYERA